MIDSFEMNKMAGAVLGTLVFAMGIGVLSDVIFHRAPPAKPGYEIAVAETPAAGESAPAEPQVPLPVLLAKANVTAGEAQAKKCQACHSLEKGGPNKVGPDLWSVVGRPVAEHAGFAYSAGMTKFSDGGKQHWTFENLFHFIAAPKTFVPGTAMGFAGIKKDQDRADLLAYLRTLADNPEPLPPVEDAGAAGAAPAEVAPNGSAPSGGNAPANGAPAEGQPAPAQ